MNKRWYVQRGQYDELLMSLDAAQEEIKRLNGVINLQFGEKDDLDDDLTEAKGRVAELKAELEFLRHEPEKVTQDMYNSLKAQRCVHCQGIHSIACPRVKRIRFRPDQTPVEVEYFENFQWPTGGGWIKWLEDLVVE
jgi:hypothetical protein